MESTNVFDRFIELVKFDQATISIKQKIDFLIDELNQLRANRSELENNLETAKRAVTAAQKEVQLQELRMQELDLKEKEKKKQLEFTSSPKEYSAIKKEIENLKHAQHAYENELVNSWNKLENTKATFEQIKKEIDEKETTLDTTMTKKEIELEELRKVRITQETERTSKLAGIPEEWLDKYNVMHLRISNPVVPVFGESCSACFGNVTQQELRELGRKKLVQCKECFRLLYLQD